MAESFRFGEFVLDRAEARLLRDGEPVELQPKVFDALVVFVERPGSLIPKDELLSRLWPEVVVTEESLTQVVRKLRVALGDDPAAPRYLETVPKRGYRFVAAIEPVGVGAPAADSGPEADSGTVAVPGPAAVPPAPLPAPPAAPAVRPRRGRRVLLAAAAAAFALAGVALVLRRSPPPPNPWLAGGEPRRLTATAARESSPAVSADGRFAAIASNLGVAGSLELELVPLDGGRTLRLTETAEDEWQPRFAPDGRSLLFLRGSAGAPGAALWTMGLFGGSERRITTGVTAADWSPDGRVIALARAGPAGSRIERLELATGATEALANARGEVPALAWSPDGRRLAYLERNAIVLLDLEARTSRPLTEPARHVRSLAWESATRLITDAAWSDGASRISRVDLAGGPPEPLLAGPPGLHELALSPAGRTVYVAEHKIRQVWTLAADGSAPRALGLPTTVEGFDVDPSGARLAYTDWDPAPGSGTLGLLDLGSGGRRDLGDGLCPAIDRDGARVAALGDRPGEEGLGLIDLSTLARAVVAVDRNPAGRSDGALFRCPEFSPDGRSIAYLTVDEKGVDGVWRVDLDAGSTRRLAHGSFGAPSWSPDGRRIAVCDYAVEPATVRLIDAAGGPPAATGLPCPFRARALWDSPDAFWLLEEQKRSPRMVLVGLDGRRLREVPLGLALDPSFWGVFEVHRTADGRWWVLSERYESDLFVLGAGGGAP